MTKKMVLVSLAFVILAAMCMPVSAWGPLAHQDAADLASSYYGYTGPAYNTIHTASNTPDTWGDVLYHGPYTPVAVGDRAYKAHQALYHGGAGDWTQEYGYATHYMTDASMPWHVSLTHNSVIDNQRHNLCEIAVHDYRSTYYNYYMQYAGSGSTSYPYGTASTLKNDAVPAADTLYNIMESNPNYASDPTYQSIIGNLLKKATKNNRAVLGWVTSSST